VILVDVNLLLYAYDDRSPHQAAAAKWLEDAFDSEDVIGIAATTIVTFVRLSTDPRVFGSALATDAAVATIDAIVALDNVTLVVPGPRHYSILREVLLASRATRNLVPDAALAALAIEHGGTIATNDRDFDRFRGPKVIYPLETR
jgi:toxin-antitoxin system PIN domain toxin